MPRRQVGCWNNNAATNHGNGFAKCNRLQNTYSRWFPHCLLNSSRSFTHFTFTNDSAFSNFICGRCAGFYSWRNTTNGSWFVQALCYVLSERGREDDLLSLMTTVSRIVSIGFESNTPQDSNMHQRKQIPCITSLLTRKIYFKRKTTRRIWNNEKIALCVSSLKSTTVFHSFSSNNPVGIYALTNLRMHWLY